MGFQLLKTKDVGEFKLLNSNNSGGFLLKNKFVVERCLATEDGFSLIAENGSCVSPDMLYYLLNEEGSYFVTEGNDLILSDSEMI